MSLASRNSKQQTERRKVNRACTECTRRKIRCDGVSIPCKNCKWYCVEDRCAYRQRNKRTNPSWKLVEQLTEAVEARNHVLAKLLPLLDFDNLPEVRREDIVQLITNDHGGNGNVQTEDPVLDRGSPSPAEDPTDEGEHEWDESIKRQDYTSPIADDVNGLALSQGSSSSYLGSSSISLALRSILALCPAAKQAFLRLSSSLSSSAGRTKQPIPAPQPQLPSDISPESFLPAAPQDQLAIDAYFDHAHPLLPMIDEEWFRTEIATRNRTDDAWVALSNMVLALGSIAAGDDRSHTIYYARVQKVVGHNVFASGHLEMLQGLILLGGAYLHYINSPNTAYLIMGTAFRMAIAMALHRDPARIASSRHNRSMSAASTPTAGYSMSRAELRRRTWWCLICTDAWSGINLGRPSITRWDPLTMDTEMPSAKSGQENASDGESQGMTDADWSATSLRVSSQFCKISSRIEYRLSQSSRLSAREILAFEGQLQTWEKARPHAFRSGTSCPYRIRNVRDTIYYRLLVARIVMSRPCLIRLTEDPAACLRYTDDDWRVVSLCRSAASDIVNHACTSQLYTRQSVWHASWYLFQACMIPLLSISVNSTLPAEMRLGEAAISTYREEVERAIRTFKSIAPLARSTDKYGEVIEALYSGVVLTGENQTSPAAVQVDANESGDFGTLGLGSPSAFEEHALDMFDTFPGWFDYELVFGTGMAQL